jgi:hypothetical protein
MKWKRARGMNIKMSNGQKSGNKNVGSNGFGYDGEIDYDDMDDEDDEGGVDDLDDDEDDDYDNENDLDQDQHDYVLNEKEASKMKNI